MAPRERSDIPADDPPRDPGRPEDAVDALEERVLGDTAAAPAGTDDAPDEDHSPAFEIDLDPEDQGSADAAAANPD